MTNRREWLSRLGLVAAAGSLGAGASANAAAETGKSKPLDLSQYEPKSMLHVHETDVERARYPVIDIHTHLSWSAKSEKGVELEAERQYIAAPSELLPLMDRRNLRALTNLTGGFGQGLIDSVNRYDKQYPGRFYTFTEPWYPKVARSEANAGRRPVPEFGHFRAAGENACSTIEQLQ